MGPHVHVDEGGGVMCVLIVQSTIDLCIEALRATGVCVLRRTNFGYSLVSLRSGFEMCNEIYNLALSSIQKKTEVYGGCVMNEVSV